MALPALTWDETARRKPRPDPRPGRRVWNVNVLLVEDDAADTSLILGVLKRHPGVASAEASDEPDLALRQLAAGRLRPDLVLLDIQMPRIDGFGFLSHLRQIPAMAHTPVVFLTTSGLARDVMAARDSTAVSYIIKPSSHGMLQARLDHVIKRAISGIWSH
jgi:putative two-component system response regulator